METFAMEAFRILVVLLVVDYALGALNALREGRFNSDVGMRGITQRLALMLVVAALFYLHLNIHSNEWVLLLSFQTLMLGAIVNQLSSIRRQMKKLGLDPVLMRWVPEDKRDAEKKESDKKDGS